MTLKTTKAQRDGCPIAAFSEDVCCYGTPYAEMPNKTDAGYQSAAKKELNYIKKVLKAGT